MPYSLYRIFIFYLFFEFPSIKGDIKKQPESFYKEFDVIISGLDSVECRRWINALLVHFAQNEGLHIPFIDGGSEGFSGQARVIFPEENACYECSMWMFPPQVTYPMCTIASNPRLPEHCAEWAILQFPKEHGLFSEYKKDNRDRKSIYLRIHIKTFIFFS